MHRSTLARGAGILLALALAASAHAQPAAVTVKIGNFTFAPQTITVPVGSTVTWINGDDVPHTVRAVDGAFASKPLDTGDSFAVTFTTPGEHAYFCSIHPMMTGKVVVRAG